MRLTLKVATKMILDGIETDGYDEADRECQAPRREFPETPVVEDSQGNSTFNSSAASATKVSKIRFNLTPQIRVIRVWDFASRQARLGTIWTQMATDRLRFRDRIKRSKGCLGDIFTVQHRNMIFERLNRHPSTEDDAINVETRSISVNHDLTPATKSINHQISNGNLVKPTTYSQLEISHGS
jgi:Phosphatase-1 catalytic subunit binding region